MVPACCARCGPPQVRPVVFEEVRLEADDDMRRLIQNIKARLDGRRAAPRA